MRGGGAQVRYSACAWRSTETKRTFAKRRQQHASKSCCYCCCCCYRRCPAKSPARESSATPSAAISPSLPCVSRCSSDTQTARRPRGCRSGWQASQSVSRLGLAGRPFWVLYPPMVFQSKPTRDSFTSHRLRSYMSPLGDGQAGSAEHRLPFRWLVFRSAIAICNCQSSGI